MSAAVDMEAVTVMPLRAVGVFNGDGVPPSQKQDDKND